MDICDSLCEIFFKKLCVFIVVNQRNVCLIAGTGNRTQHSDQVRYCVHLICLQKTVNLQQILSALVLFQRNIRSSGINTFSY